MKPKLLNYFSRQEQLLWLLSVMTIGVSFFLFDGKDCLTLTASLIGVTSLIFCAKGNPFGQLLMILFSVLYGIISFRVAYYGEMTTYLGMTAPMALFALISWLKNPYEGNKSEVKVNRIGRGEYLFLSVLTLLVTVVFYFILRYFGTANLLPSTLSVATSFAAVYLTFRRSPYYAIGYAANDLILIVLWLLAAVQDPACLSVLACFAAFLANDIYGFISWRGMEKRQSDRCTAAE